MTIAQTVKIVSYSLIGLGLLFFSNGMMFKYMRWPDGFHGIVTGPILIAAGIVFLFLKKIIMKERGEPS